MRKPTRKPPKHQVDKIDGPMSFTIYSAGPGQVGGGYLVFHKTWVEVVLKPDSAWKQATKAKRKDSNKLTQPDGTWKLWFLLSRALVLSRESIMEAEREIGPAHSEEESENHVCSAGKIRAMAAEMRSHAILESFVMGENIPLEVASSDNAFIDWFEARMAERFDENDQEFLEAVNGFVRAASGLQSGYPRDVQALSTAIRKLAWEVGGPPSKASVKLALGKEFVELFAKKEAIKYASKGSIGRSPQGKKSADLIDPNKITRLLNRAGFSWLPNGKPGPQLQTKAGKGRGVETFDAHPEQGGRRF
jgi:hypothetical protein